ncbi:hypothetical protein HDU82_006071 [Entophlyctis luteolus]|nr:hypothetical protein HDU82_006071 [Entophlyctis luteolus]
MARFSQDLQRIDDRGVIPTRFQRVKKYPYVVGFRSLTILHQLAMVKAFGNGAVVNVELSRRCITDERYGASIYQAEAQASALTLPLTISAAHAISATPAAPLTTAARLAKNDLNIRVRIGSEHDEVLAVKLAAPTLAALAEAKQAAQKKDSSLLLPLVVRFNGALLSDDDDLADFLSDVRVRSETFAALVVVSARSSRRPAVGYGPADRLESSERVKANLAGSATPAVDHETVLAPHQVMLSYNWGVKTATGKYDMQELVKCIAAELKRSSLSVWMDVERGVDSVPLMNGVIHDKMAAAVHNCQVFVAVVTAKYQESPNCKLEFNYAAALQKPIVPVYADTKPLLTDSVHMVTLPVVQARLASIFSSCQASLDFRSHADWDNQMAVLKAEIIAKLSSAPHSNYLFPRSQTAPIQPDIAAFSSNIYPAAVPTAPVTSETPASGHPEASDVAVPATISNAARGDTVAADSTSVNFYMKRELQDWLNPVSFEF